MELIDYFKFLFIFLYFLHANAYFLFEEQLAMITDEHHKPTYRPKATATTTRFVTITTTKSSTTTKPTTTTTRSTTTTTRSTTRSTTTTTRSTTTTTATSTPTTTATPITTSTKTTTRSSFQIIRYCSGGFTVDPNGGVSTCTSDAYNNTRFASELDCIFPFNYKGTWIDSCITTDKGYYWCSVDRYYANKFAACDSYCPLLAQAKVKGTNDTHAACLQIPSNSGVVPLFPDQTQINLILDMHNQIRSNVSYPSLNPNVTTVYPSATDMRAVYWDVSLARNAQKWVEYLAGYRLFKHDCNECRVLLNNQSISVGQNLFAVINLPYNATVLWQWSILGAWYGEKSQFIYGATWGSATGDFETVGHYTQLVTSGVSRIGCGVAMRNKTLYTGCNYAYAQFNPSKPYTSGTSCSKCGSQNCVNNLCKCNRFCQNFGTLDWTTCKCTCPPYATGDECEIKLCNLTDQQYACYNPFNSTFCIYANVKLQCPHMCGFCTYLNY